ncbi:MAG: dethiobiotin synthase [Rhodobiaceae bacterium]|nr:dethiobiotin synthase [Rhodobiaceae bacterium]
MKTIFVTASGTEIGKTFIATTLVRQLRAQGLKVRALKPVVSDVTAENFSQSDTALMIDVLGETPDAKTIDAVSPWRFEPALSPDMAARREGRSIDFEELISFCEEGRKGDHDVTVIEGVGGLMVPLDDQHLVRDWIVRLNQTAPLEIVVVVGAYLGTVSHSLTTLSSLREVELTPKIVVVSERDPGPVSLDETMETIARFAPEVNFMGMPQQQDDVQPPDITAALL